MTHEQLLSAQKVFRQQQRNAQRRGIGWELTFWQWYVVWRNSGHWAQRGRGQGYVMCRNGDSGPYAVGNVFIATAAQNSSDATKRADLPLGVSRIERGAWVRFRAMRTINRRTLFLGYFSTPELAHDAYLKAA